MLGSIQCNYQLNYVTSRACTASLRRIFADSMTDYCSPSDYMQDNTHDSVDKVYEVGYVFVSSIPEEKIEGEVASLKALLSKVDAKTIAEEAPELRPLAYTMVKKIHGANKRFTEGYFGWIKFELTPSAVETLKKSLDATENILRYLFITTVKENTYLGKKSIVMASAMIDAKDMGVAVNPIAASEAIDKGIDDMIKEA